MATPSRGSGRSPRPRAGSGPGRGRATGGRRQAAGRPVQQGPGEGRPRSRLTGRSALLFVVLAVLVVSYASSARAWLDQRAHINGLEDQIATDRARVDQLTEEKERWEDPAYVEAQARERFGYVMPGEVSYRVIDENGEPLGVTSELGEPTPRPENDGPAWWDTAWDSVQAAGADPDEESDEQAPARFIGPRGRTR